MHIENPICKLHNFVVVRKSKKEERKRQVQYAHHLNSQDGWM